MHWGSSKNYHGSDKNVKKSSNLFPLESLQYNKQYMRESSQQYDKCILEGNTMHDKHFQKVTGVGT